MKTGCVGGVGGVEITLLYLCANMDENIEIVVACTSVILRPHSIDRTSWELVGNPGFQLAPN
jgi:hypothetical protein